MTLLFRSYDSGPFLLLSSSSDAILTTKPPRSLSGDTYKDGTLVRGIHKCIVGIVDFKSRVSMGRSGHGVPLYLFHPFDAGYPPFIVGSKTRPDENLICTMEFASWPDSSEWPRGAIQDRLGPVGGAVERAAHIRSATVGKLTEEGHVLPDLSAYKTEVWDSVFNIDPVGCEDVDDILAYRVTPTGTQWLIGIADVAAFVPEGSPMDLVAAKRGQTLYDNGTVVAPMLPNIVSTGLASLRCDGARRPVIGLVVTVPLEGAARCESLELHQIIVTHSYSYESVPTDVGKHVASLSAALGAVSSDPHVWIETVMVAYNCHVAHLLRTAGVGLLRRLSAGTGYVEIAEASGCPEIAFLGRAAGEYCSASEEDIAHAGLGVAEYCHASSPLRRYADLVNQRCLHALLWGGKALSVGAAYLNHRAFVSRRMERDLWFLERVPIGAISTTKGIAIDSDSVYCAEWKRVVNVFSDTLLIPGSSVIVRAYIDPASPRRRVVCQATAAAAAST